MPLVWNARLVSDGKLLKHVELHAMLLPVTTGICVIPFFCLFYQQASLSKKFICIFTKGKGKAILFYVDNSWQ